MKRSSTCSAWMCPATCSTDAGSEVSSCTAASATHWLQPSGGGREDHRPAAGNHRARCHGNPHRAGNSPANRHLLGDAPGYGCRLRGTLHRHHRPGDAQLLAGYHVVLYPSLWWAWSPPMKWVPFTEDRWGTSRCWPSRARFWARPSPPPPCA